MARAEQEEEQKDTASWMMTFSDLSTLLLTFFVLLLSMSSLNDRAFRNAFVNFNKASGILFYKNKEKVSLQRDTTVDDLVKTLNSLYLLEMRDLTEMDDSEYADEEVDVVLYGNTIFFHKRPKEMGFSFIFGEQMLFEKGSAKLNPVAFPVLNRIAEFLKKSNYRAYIDGHTDNIPIHTDKFPDNDALSVARAMSVLGYFLDRCMVPAKQLAVGGYGSSHPLADNETETGRAKNRRVEIIFKKLK